MSNGKIPEAVERILDGYGVTATIYADEDYIEIEGWTEHNGNMIHSLYVKQDELNDLDAWSKAWHDMCEGFDPWHETDLWCENGVPVRTPFDNAKDLYNDINDYKRDTLKGIDRDLHRLCQRGSDMSNKRKVGDTIEVTTSDCCPMCGSSEVESNEVGFEYGYMYSDSCCLSCHGSYTMWFKPSHAVVTEIGTE